jgi:hypothetical protein
MKTLKKRLLELESFTDDELAERLLEYLAIKDSCEADIKKAYRQMDIGGPYDREQVALLLTRLTLSAIAADEIKYARVKMAQRGLADSRPDEQPELGRIIVAQLS